MRTSLLVRTGLLGAAAFVAVAIGAPAWADTTISINPGNVPTTAAGFDNHSCDSNQGGGPFAGQDVWVFVLPGTHITSGDFVSVTADFGPDGTVTITAAANPGNFDNGGPETAKAWIVQPAGETLVGATAVITGTASFFNLTHTCPASSGPSSPPPSSPPPSSPPPSSPSSTPPSSPSGPPSSPGTTPSPSLSETTGPTPSGGVQAGGGDSGPSGGLAWGLGALILAAAASGTLVVARRYRDHA